MIVLQEAMVKIKALEDERDAIPEQLAGLKMRMLDTRMVYEKTSAEYLELKNRKKALEEKIEEEKVEVEKSKARLMTITTNREYFAMLKEIDMNKRMNRQREDELLELMVKFEEVSGNYEDTKKEYEELNEEYEKEMSKVQEQMKGFDRGIHKLEEEKEKIVQKLDRNKTRRFEMVFSRRKGLAVVPARNYICTGCNMNLPPQLFNLLQRDDRIYECPNCSRIIFFENGEDQEVS